MTLKRFMQKNGLNLITILAITSLATLIFVPQGRNWAVDLELTNPAAFYWGLGSFYLATFGTWVAMQIKRWK